MASTSILISFFFQAEDGIRDKLVTGVQTCALPISRIVEAVRKRGEVALRKHAERFGDVSRGAPLYYNRADLARALAGLSPEERTRLERVAGRIRGFAVAQRGALGPVSVPVPGGIAEHRITPMQRAGCYAPGGRYALPSSVLMAAGTARVAGVGGILGGG